MESLKLNLVIFNETSISFYPVTLRPGKMNENGLFVSCCKKIPLLIVINGQCCFKLGFCDRLYFMLDSSVVEELVSLPRLFICIKHTNGTLTLKEPTHIEGVMLPPCFPPVTVFSVLRFSPKTFWQTQEK